MNTDITEGTPVHVRKDDGSILETITLSKPWQLGHGAWVVKVGGISGGYNLERVTVVDGITKDQVNQLTYLRALLERRTAVVAKRHMELNGKVGKAWDDPYFDSIEGDKVYYKSFWHGHCGSCSEDTQFSFPVEYLFADGWESVEQIAIHEAAREEAEKKAAKEKADAEKAKANELALLERLRQKYEPPHAI